MAHNYLVNANISENIHGGFYVLHPSNDAILASCDTIHEAREIVEGFNNFGEAMNRTSGTKFNN